MHHLGIALICAILGFAFLIIAGIPELNKRFGFLPWGLAFAFLSTFVTQL